MSLFNSNNTSESITWPSHDGGYGAMVGARANSNRTISVFFNNNLFYTGDNGTNVTLSDMCAAFGYYAGTTPNSPNYYGYATAFTIGPF